MLAAGHPSALLQGKRAQRRSSPPHEVFSDSTYSIPPCMVAVVTRVRRVAGDEKAGRRPREREDETERTAPHFLTCSKYPMYESTASRVAFVPPTPAYGIKGCKTHSKCSKCSARNRTGAEYPRPGAIFGSRNDSNVVEIAPAVALPRQIPPAILPRLYLYDRRPRMAAHTTIVGAMCKSHRSGAQQGHPDERTAIRNAVAMVCAAHLLSGAK